jgi:hypothetical protein
MVETAIRDFPISQDQLVSIRKVPLTVEILGSRKHFTTSELLYLFKGPS